MRQQQKTQERKRIQQSIEDERQRRIRAAESDAEKVRPKVEADPDRLYRET